MIGGVTRRGAFPGLADGVTLSARVAFSHVNVSPRVTRLAGPNSCYIKFAQNSTNRLRYYDFYITETLSKFHVFLTFRETIT